MKIYTKTGDKGTTSLVGGARVEKTCAQLEAYGTIDELNALIGTALEEVLAATIPTDHAPLRQNLAQQLLNIQKWLFAVGGILATEVADREKYWQHTPLAEWTQQLETQIDALTAQLPELHSFILPSGSKSAAQLHVARTVARRAERRICQLSDPLSANDPFFVAVSAFINRLSDFLFVAARYVLFLENKKEIYVK